MALSLMVKCEWGRSERFRALLEQQLGAVGEGVSVRSCCATKARGATHGGHVWVRIGAPAGPGPGVDGAQQLASAVGALRAHSSFGRFFAAMFPTRRVLQLPPTPGRTPAVKKSPG